MVLEDGAVSRQHAQISQSHNSYYIEDLRSRNGTQVNDADVHEATLLKEGDVVRVCEYTWTFHEVGSSTDIFKGKSDLSSGSFKGESRSGSKGGSIGDTSQGEESAQERSSIISRIDVRSGSGVRLSVKPEVKLRAVVEIGRHLTNALNVDDVLPRILDALFQIYGQADQAFVLLADSPDEEPQVRASRNRREDDDSMSVSRTIVNRALETGEAILSADASDDSRFASSESLAGLRIRSMMCVPLVTQNDANLGVIQLTTFDLRSKFNDDDLDLLVNIATQFTLAIENAHLHQTVLKQRDMDRELEFAMQVQLGFLPNKRPLHENYEFSDYYEAAQHVGGDYFDYVTFPDGRIAVTVADVAGKGVPAALLMARLYSATRYHLLTQPTLADAMSGLNSEISTSGLGHRFITCAIIVIDPVKHEATLVSAGHLAPMRRNLSGKVEQIEGNDMGLPLGIIPDQKFEQDVYPVNPGDTWVMYTDGVTEAMRENRELYGSSRLLNFIGEASFEVDNLVKEVVDDVAAFVGERAQSDDLCLVGFQRNP